MNLKRSDKYVALSDLRLWKNIKKLCKNNKFKIPAPTWNTKFELPDGSYSISDIQDYLEYIFKKRGKNTVNPSIRIHVNKIENRITFKVKAGYWVRTRNWVEINDGSRGTYNSNSDIKFNLNLVGCNFTSSVGFSLITQKR